MRQAVRQVSCGRMPSLPPSPAVAVVGLVVAAPPDGATSGCGWPHLPATLACRAGLERLALAAVETDRGGRVAKARTAEYRGVP
jgi:hypothetical protein